MAAVNAPKAKKKFMSLKRRELIFGYVFILPWLIGITAFFIVNMIRTAQFSFSFIEISPEEGVMLTNVGFDNFVFIFREHGTFFREMFESVADMFISLPLIIFFSLFMAIILNRKFMGRGLVRAIFFLPVILGSQAISSSIETAIGMIFNSISGLPPEVMRDQQGFSATSVIMLLDSFQIPPQIINFMVDAIANLHEIIRAAGVQILIFLAALQSIPPSMYEVAQIEGATGYETFWKITIPMVSPLILTNVVYTVVDTYANSPVVETARTTFFTDQNFGASVAMSLSTALLVCTLLFGVCWIIGKRVFYYD